VQLTAQQQIQEHQDRRAAEREAPAVPTTVQLTLHEADGNRSINAQLLSISYSGLGVSCNQALCPGTKLTYVHPTRANKSLTARIAWCKGNEGEKFEHGIMVEAFEAGNRIDYYSLLEVNPTAEPCMIDAAYEFLAHRYHPQNPQTANVAIYERLAEAYEVLSDPVKRTEYDLERRANKSGDVAKGDRNRNTIRSKRAQMLEMLYWRRVESPYKPIITIHEFETILKIPKEQLEFNLWFLRDKGMIIRSDNACFVISADGVAAVEMLEESEMSKPDAEQSEEQAAEAQLV
jgi:hypothetical protein